MTATTVPTAMDAIIGVADNVGSGALPINGLRHRRGSTSGWFVWAGELLGADANFFRPMHTRHLIERCPEILPMLGLPEGWRFLIAPGHEDAWFDQALLDHVV